MHKVAPWMFSVVYKEMTELPEEGDLPSNLTRCEFFDGGNFHADVSADGVRANTITAFFEYLRTASRAGKMVVTFIDDVDIIVLGKHSQEMLEQFAMEVNNW